MNKENHDDEQKQMMMTNESIKFDEPVKAAKKEKRMASVAVALSDSPTNRNYMNEKKNIATNHGLKKMCKVRIVIQKVQTQLKRMLESQCSLKC